MIYFIYDTETTGLIQNTAQSLDKQPRLIELYGCLCDEEGNILEEINILCNPGIGVTDEITDITGIRDEDVKNLPLFSKFSQLVKEIISKADAIVAHNLSYDSEILRVEFQRLKEEIVFPKIKICTVEETEHLKGHRLSLGNLYEILFGVPFVGAHRAKADVGALKEIFFKLKQQGEI